MAVSKRLRYEVLRRDNYTCRYCGAKAPGVQLNVDAVVPDALGGSHKDPANLVTACEACNGGKTSSSPDAPLVADVAEDALRWSKAMQVAQAGMLADLERRERNRQQFAEWWDVWGYGLEDDRQRIPKDPGWEQTVDQLTAAGLPMPIIQDCIAIAMRQKKIKTENIFRYMCGVAWSKLTEMQDTARKAVGAEAIEQAPGADPYEQGRLEFARELLGEVSQEERDHFVEQADINEYLTEAGDPPQSETEITCYAVTGMLNSIRCDWDILATRVEEMLRALPDGVGEKALNAPQTKLTTLTGPYGRRTFQITDALYALEDLLNLPAARTLMDSLPSEERDEWICYARALSPHAELDDDRWLVRAANCARVIADGRWWDEMCTARGDHISACPRRCTYYVRIAELDCCGPDEPAEHKGHRICEHHLEQLMDGTLAAARGGSLSARDFTEITSVDRTAF